MEQNENTLTVLEIVPGQYPKQVEIDPDLKSLQQAVGGNIGASYPFSDPVAIVYNDEGKLMGLPLNRALRDGSGEGRAETPLFLGRQGTRPEPGTPG